VAAVNCSQLIFVSSREGVTCGRDAGNCLTHENVRRGAGGKCTQVCGLAVTDLKLGRSSRTCVTPIKLRQPCRYVFVTVRHVSEDELGSYFVDCLLESTRNAIEEHLLVCNECLERFLERAFRASPPSGDPSPSGGVR